MERVGVRELRQHASRVLARVAAGETVEVTDRGRPVARIVPLPPDRWRDLLARGLVTPPAVGSDLLEEAPRDYGIDASAALEANRIAER